MGWMDGLDGWNEWMELSLFWGEHRGYNYGLASLDDTYCNTALPLSVRLIRRGLFQRSKLAHIQHDAAYHDL